MKLCWAGMGGVRGGFPSFQEADLAMLSLPLIIDMKGMK